MNLTTNDSGKSLSSVRCQVITWTNAALLSIEPLGTNLIEIRISIHIFSFTENVADENIVCEMAAILSRERWVNSLRPSDAIWRQWSWTTLAQVMACCLTAPSHYLNQCWLIIRGVLWHTSESSFAGIAQGIDSGYEFEKDILKNIFKSPRGQWVKGLDVPLWYIS